jgi:peptide/nickel transport system substrate-binding protein
VIGVAALSAAAVSGAATAARSASLAVQFAGPPISLNPALGGNGGSSVYTALDYDPLIYLSGSGQFVPDLASSWRFVGRYHRAFEMTLRSGVKFSDGSRLTARAVVNSMKYFMKAGGQLVGNVGSIDSITAPNAHTVLIKYKTANPDAPGTMDQFYGIGEIIGPKGLASPTSLLTSSDGTGQYVYDNSASTTNSTYTYKRNPGYFNTSAQHFNQVQVKVIGDPSAVLSAMQTNQIQFAGGAPNTLAAAQSAGLKIFKQPFFQWELIIPWKNNVVPQLNNPLVREAIGYALNRQAIARAIGASVTTPATEVTMSKADGYVKGSGYTYDLAKAKQLMSQAGYGSGFTVPVVTESLIDVNTTISQALTQSLAAIGIKTQMTVVSTGIGQFATAAQSGQYGIVIFPGAGTDMYQVANQLLPPGIFNPAHLPTPPAIAQTLSKAYGADGAAQTKLYQKADKQLDALNSWIPGVLVLSPNYVSSKLENVTESFLNPNPLPVGPTSALSWSLK